MSLTVVPLREAPSLNDIVAHLRNFADRIEAGEYGEVAEVIAIMPVRGDYPLVFSWGDVIGENDPVIQLELAKLWLLTNQVIRRG